MYYITTTIHFVISVTFPLPHPKVSYFNYHLLSLEALFCLHISSYYKSNGPRQYWFFKIFKNYFVSFSLHFLSFQLIQFTPTISISIIPVYFIASVINWCDVSIFERVIDQWENNYSTHTHNNSYFLITLPFLFSLFTLYTSIFLLGMLFWSIK